MVLTNAERQARHRETKRREAYNASIHGEQIAQLETAVNEVRAKLGMAEIQVVKPAQHDD